MKSILPCPLIEAEPSIRAATAPPKEGVEKAVEAKVHDAFEKGWGVVVWNDPVNTMSYVTYVFQKVLKLDLEAAQRHMLEVHNQGKSLVASETRERAEFLVHQIQAFGLKATMERL
jgi:ATP-dependent Clp protease adaptor protein ClpS